MNSFNISGRRLHAHGPVGLDRRALAITACLCAIVFVGFYALGRKEGTPPAAGETAPLHLPVVAVNSGVPAQLAAAPSLEVSAPAPPAAAPAATHSSAPSTPEPAASTPASAPAASAPAVSTPTVAAPTPAPAPTAPSSPASSPSGGTQASGGHGGGGSSSYEGAGTSFDSSG